MWAMIPMLRTLARTDSTVVTALVSSRLLVAAFSSPAVVREGLVRLGHLVGVLTPLDGGAEAVARVEQLVHQPLGHRLLAALPGVPDQPAQRQGGAAAGPHLDRHLVRRPADPPALHLDRRL